jgi:hypothetical protein
MARLDDVEDVTPFDEPVKERGYSQPFVNATKEQIFQTIPEASFTPPPVDLNPGNPFASEMDAGQQQKRGRGRPKKEAPPPINPSMEDMEEAERKESAKFVAKLVLDGYEMLNQLANNLVTVSEDKLKRQQMDGEIDLTLQVPYDMAGNTISVGEFVQEYNSQAGDTFKVDPEFRKDVEPVMIRVFEKRGIGLTDEQYLMVAFGKDIAIKAITGFQMKRTINGFINAVKEQTEVIRQGGVPMDPTPPPPDPGPAGYEPAGYAQPVPEYDTSGFSNYAEPEEVMESEDDEIHHSAKPKRKLRPKNPKDVNPN